MPLWTCDSSGCSKESKSVVLDANWRWLHNGQYTNCRLERLSLSWKLSGQEGSTWKAKNLFGKDKIWRNDKLVRWVCCQLVCAYLFCIWSKVQGYDTVHQCSRHHASGPCPVLITATLKQRIRSCKLCKSAGTCGGLGFGRFGPRKHFGFDSQKLLGVGLEDICPGFFHSLPSLSYVIHQAPPPQKKRIPLWEFLQNPCPVSIPAGYKDGDFNRDLCPDPLTCAENCHLEGNSKAR